MEPTTPERLDTPVRRGIQPYNMGTTVRPTVIDRRYSGQATPPEAGKTTREKAAQKSIFTKRTHFFEGSEFYKEPIINGL
jgi:hypothetical protein